MAFLLHLFISMSLCQKQRVKLFTVDSSYCVHQDNTARPASHVSLEHQGSRWWIISYSLALSLVPGPGENPWAILVLLRLCDIKDIRHSFITSEILHVVWKEPLSVCVCPSVYFVSTGNGWQWKMWPIQILIAIEKRLHIYEYCPYERQSRV